MTSPESVSRTRLSRRGFLTAGTALAAGLAAPSLAACGRAPKTGGSGGGGSKTFTMYWNPGHVYDAYTKVVDQFAKDHGVTVNWQKFQWPDLQTKIQTDLKAGTVPDLVEQPSGDAAMALVLTGDVLALTDYIAKDGKKTGYPDDYLSQSVAPWTHDDKIWGVPLHLTCNQLYYNKGMLSDAGIDPPETWDDFLAAAKELTGKGRYGTALNQDYSYSYPWFLQNGAKWYDAPSKQVLAPHDAALAAMQFQYELVHKHKVSPAPVPSTDYEGPQRLFSAKRAAMILTGPWDIEPIHKGSPDIELGLALPLKEKEQATHLAGSGVFIPKKAKNPDLAWDLIKRLTKLEIELQVTKDSGISMPRKSWSASSQVKADKTMTSIADALKVGTDWGREMAPTGKSPEVSDAYKTFYQSVVCKGTKPEKAMPEFLEAAKKALG